MKRTKRFTLQRIFSKLLSMTVALILGFFLMALSPSIVSAVDVTLAWDANVETDLAGYKMYYGATSGGPYSGTGATEGSSPVTIPLSSLSDAQNPNFILSNLGSGDWYFVVTAYDNAGNEGGVSNEATYAPFVLIPPINPGGIYTDPDSVRLTWDIQAGATDYGIYIRRATLGWDPAPLFIVTAPPYDVPVDFQDISYIFAIVARDAQGTETAKSANITFYTGHDLVSPVDPTGLMIQ